jgi:hypothetical protein
MLYFSAILGAESDVLLEWYAKQGREANQIKASLTDEDVSKC